jgi:tRNA-5-methyluridine54 2-sulfurtransferase
MDRCERTGRTPVMKCSVCRGPAGIRAPRHNAAFCDLHFREHFLRQVQRAIESRDMFREGDSILLGVSGGKDSMVAWEILTGMGLEVQALHLNHGFGPYSERSEEVVRAHAARAARPLEVRSFRGLMGVTFEQALRVSARPACSLCGTVKRYWMNRTALELGCTVAATGHNLDDEASALLGNVLHWQTGYLRSRLPALPEGEGMVRKVKPLFRVTDEETRLYAGLAGLEFVEDACPYAENVTTHYYKGLLERMEREFPNIKGAFYLGFLDRLLPGLSAEFRRAEHEMRRCPECGYRTLREGRCTVCTLKERAAGSPGKPDRAPPA